MAALEYGMRTGLVAAIVGGMATAFFGGVPPLISGPRAAGALVLMGFVRDWKERNPAE
jgi:MFS superfamily sulfate permease-like transporter